MWIIQSLQYSITNCVFHPFSGLMNLFTLSCTYFVLQPLVTTNELTQMQLYDTVSECTYKHVCWNYQNILNFFYRLEKYHTQPIHRGQLYDLPNITEVCRWYLEKCIWNSIGLNVDDGVAKTNLKISTHHYYFVLYICMCINNVHPSLFFTNLNLCMNKWAVIPSVKIKTNRWLKWCAEIMKNYTVSHKFNIQMYM